MARIEVPMPQMGESIAEGTVSKWLKAVGDPVKRDEPILEISTDKVDAEIPSPSDGTLVEILAQEGETVEVGTVVAFIDPEGGDAVAPPPVREAVSPPDQSAIAESEPFPAAEVEATAAPVPPEAQGAETAEGRLRARSTPVVRKIAEDQGVDLSRVPGTGHAGRVTKEDILAFIETGGAAAVPSPPVSQAPPPPPAVVSAAPAAPAPASPMRVPSELWTAFYGQVQH
ncbi:biotin/lipoyl-containing protein, partial [Gemmatimonadota bacterium]